METHKKIHKTAKGTELPILNLKGKDYLQVQWRVVWFREDHPMGQIRIECQERNDKFVIYKAIISVPIPGSTSLYTVLAEAVKREDYAHFTDADEKASTGAVGRAMALIGYGTQFCADELDEKDRIVDAPVEKKAQAKAKAPFIMKDPGAYVITIGQKFNGKKLHEVPKADLKVIAEHCRQDKDSPAFVALTAHIDAYLSSEGNRNMHV